MKYLNDFFELCYEIVIYIDKFSNIDIDIEVMCRIYFGSSFGIVIYVNFFYVLIVK